MKASSRIPATGRIDSVAARTKKAPSDTVDGCRDRATADFASASIMGTANQRLRLEHSAESWLARGAMIQRLNDSFEARRAAQTALWLAEDPPEAPPSGSASGDVDHVRL